MLTFSRADTVECRPTMMTYLPTDLMCAEGISTLRRSTVGPPADLIAATMSDAAIERYVALDRPLDCAGSIRTEAAGPTLFEYMRSDDPSAIMGLPLIALARGLRGAGFELP